MKTGETKSGMFSNSTTVERTNILKAKVLFDHEHRDFFLAVFKL